jgi:pSer/pThr/pTyr-binding forkhead associated (FHA) protein
VTRTGATLPLPQSNQALIGRADPVSHFTPDVDLGGYDALDQGVGRRHARLLVQNGQIVVEDLYSTNGTIVNGQRLQPRQPQPLQNGDQLQFGRLMLQVQF